MKGTVLYCMFGKEKGTAVSVAYLRSSHHAWDDGCARLAYPEFRDR